MNIKEMDNHDLFVAGMSVDQVQHWMSNTRKRKLVPLLTVKRGPTSKLDKPLVGALHC
jgi:hypothetical protein